MFDVQQSAASARQERHRRIVVGAGIAGLVAAHETWPPTDVHDRHREWRHGVPDPDRAPARVYLEHGRIFNPTATRRCAGCSTTIWAWPTKVMHEGGFLLGCSARGAAGARG